MLVGFVGRVIQNVCSKGKVSNLHLYCKPGREVRCHNELCQLRHVEAETTCQNCELSSRRLETLNPTLSILASRNLMCPEVSEPDVLALQATRAAAFSHGAEDHSDDADGSVCKSLLVRRSFRDLMVGTPSSFSSGSKDSVPRYFTIFHQPPSSSTAPLGPKLCSPREAGCHW